jgi:cytochrome b involved in lipid metabolism
VSIRVISIGLLAVVVFATAGYFGYSLMPDSQPKTTVVATRTDPLTSIPNREAPPRVSPELDVDAVAPTKNTDAAPSDIPAKPAEKPVVVTPTPTPTPTPAPVPSPLPAPSPAPAPKPSGYTMAEVATHNSSASCWSVINGSVYDLTSYVSRHPGGERKILNICGKDGTSAFLGQHGGDSKPEKILTSLRIGAQI